MAKNRFGHKGRGRGGKRGGKRVSQKRRAAGKRAWAKQVKRYGSHAAAVAAVFGHRPGGGKRGRSGKRGGKGRKHGHRFGGAGSLYRIALKDIQKRNGSEGWPSTAAEREAAEQVVHFGVKGDRGRDTSSAEERQLRAFADKIAREKKNMAAQLFALKARQKREEAARREKEEAARDIDRMAAQL